MTEFGIAVSDILRTLFKKLLWMILQEEIIP